MDNQNILITGGGTGGHLMPGIALYEKLSDLYTAGSVRFLCTGRKFDRDVLSRRNVEFVTVESPPWSGLGKEFPRFVRKFSSSYLQSLAQIRRWNPSVIVALGGFGSAPAGLAAYTRGIPLVVLDQNVVPGRAARALSRISDLFVLQWEKAKEYVPNAGNTSVLGNPLRSQIRNSPGKEKARKQLSVPENSSVLLVMGGSQGARPINNWVRENISRLEDAGDDLFVIHITGPHDFDEMQSLYRDRSVSHQTIHFTEEIQLYYSAADLVLSRAGGTTIAELTYLRKPSVLIPYPHATENHQLQNAKEIERTGGGIVLSEDSLSGSQFQHQVLDTLSSREKLIRMKEGLEEIRKPDATERVSNCILDLARGKD